MARTLPWLVKSKRETGNETKSSSPASKRKRDATSSDLVDEDLNTTGVSTPERRKKIKSGRAASSSPPPVPEEPPPVEYMREGLTQDDAWMMVEDEFYSTAQVFTKHIHHAEYVRLKKRAKARGADTLREIARPTDGRTAQSTGTKLESEAMERRKRIQKGLKEMESDEEEDEYMHNPQLAALMTGTQSIGQELTGVPKLKSNTRAAAGFSKSPKKAKARADTVSHDLGKAPAKPQVSSPPDEDTESETDSDDLDASPRPKRPAQAAQTERLAQVTKTAIASASRSTSSSNTSNVFKQFSKHAASASEETGKRQAFSPTRTSTSKEMSKIIKAEPTSSAKAEGSSVFDQIADAPRKTGILAKLKAAREKQEREKMKKEEEEEDAVGEVPTFLV